MVNNPLVSVIIPVYNVEKYLDECLSSIINQTYTNLEIILVNDGSKDNSLKICKDWQSKDKRIIVFNQENSGLSITRNVGFSKSTGRYLIFIDSDDYWNDTQMIGDLINILEGTEDSLDFIDFNMTYFYQNQDKKIPLKNYDSILGTETDKDKKILTMVKNGTFPMSACTKIFRADFLKSNKISFISGIYSEDIPWFLEILVKSKNYIMINKHYYMYRKQTSGITSSFSEKKYNDLLDIVTNELEKVKALNNKNIKQAFRSFLAYQYTILLGFVQNFNGIQKKVELKKLLLMKDILTNNIHPKVKFTNKIISIFGIKVTTILLNFYIKLVVNR